MAAAQDPLADAGSPQRLDKWLWFARLTKSRTLAAELILGGKVRVNRAAPASPATRCDRARW